MEGNKSSHPEVIDLREVIKKIWANKRLFFIVWPITFVLACIYILSVPRYYVSEVKLAPEMDNNMNSGGLGALASSFGFDLSDMQTTDAITPLLYPDLMEDNGFVHTILNTKVTSQDGEISTSYHDYQQKYQKQAWWAYPIQWLKSLLPKPKDKGGSKGTYDPYYISLKENNLYVAARSNITVGIDKKTGVISISVKSQDALICRTLGDSIKDKLQFHITQYRTSKARIDYDYYKELTDTAKREYEVARRKYAQALDASTHVTLQSVSQKLEDMQSDMNLKFSTYSTLNNQLQTAKAKVQEKIPAFTVIKGATVPVKPAGPKRMIFVAAMLFLGTCCTIAYIFKKEISRMLTHK